MSPGMEIGEREDGFSEDRADVRETLGRRWERELTRCPSFLSRRRLL